MAGLSRKLSTALLKFYFKNEETGVTKPAKIFVSLLTSVPANNGVLGTELAEASGAEGYVKKEWPAAEVTATEAETSLIENSADLVFAAITGGSATVVAWAITDKSGAKEGNMLAFGTATSTVISSTQTPPTIVKKTLKVEIK